MRKFLCCLLSLLLLFSNLVYATDYTYFSDGHIFMRTKINADSIAKLGQTYYATDQEGYLFKSAIFTEWIPITSAPANCRLITTHRADADRLFVYVPGTLYVTYDGEIFHAIENFAQDAVIRYNSGLFTALQKNDDGFLFRYSFDGEIWLDYPQPLTNPTLWILHPNANHFIVKNLATANGIQDAVLDKAAPESVQLYHSLVYDFTKNAFDENPTYTSLELVYADKTSHNTYLLVYRTAAGMTDKYEIVRLNEDRSVLNTSAVLASPQLELHVYNDTLCFAKNGSSLNLVNVGSPLWYQVSDDIAFPLIRSAYALTGNVFFDTGYTDTYYCKNAKEFSLPLDGVEVNLQGNYIAFDSAPQLINNRTMVPLRAIAEALGCTIDYNAQAQQIQVDKDGYTIYMTIGSAEAHKYLADGTHTIITLDTPPIIVDGRTLVPLRFLSENLNISVDWDSKELTVNLK